MKLKQNKTQVYLLLIFSLALLIGVGYAALSATLKINGQTTINKASWDVHMENINVTSGSVTATTVPTLDTAKTTVNFSVKLTNPGDFYEFTVKEVNKGTIDAMVSTISKTGLTSTQAKYLDYTVTYDSGLALADNQLLKSGKTENLRIKVAFKKDITAQDLPTSDTTLNLNLSLSYQQAESNAVAIVHPTCKRATTLHTGICENNGNNDNPYCSGAYSIGDRVAFGNLGTTGVLTTGDAFDCDVNGDGVYDPETERFYYVSNYYDTETKTFNDEYVTLIYYSNTIDGVASNENKLFEYDANKNTSDGPVLAIKQLPTADQWKNISLYKNKRNMIDSSGNIQINNFDYSTYAARFITYFELKNGCLDENDNFFEKNILLKRCGFTLENTDYFTSSLASGYYTEAKGSIGVLEIYTNNGDIETEIPEWGGISSIRPAIEVLKSKISY